MYGDCAKCGKYLGSMDVNQPQYLSPADWGGGLSWPDPLLILVTPQNKQWRLIKLILCQWKKLNLLKIQKNKWIQSDKLIFLLPLELNILLGEATKLEYYASDIEKWTVEKVAVVDKGEAAKDFKICTYTGMKKCRKCDKCGNIFL